MIGSDARSRRFARRRRVWRGGADGRHRLLLLLLLGLGRRREDGVVKFFHIFVLRIGDGFVLDLDFPVFAEDADAVFVPVGGNHVASEVGSVAEILGANLAVESVFVVRRHDVTPQVGSVGKFLAALAARRPREKGEKALT